MAAFPPEVLGLGLIIIGGMILGGIATLFRQPLILAYIAIGVVLGSHGLGIIPAETQIILSDLSSELGIAFLLFVVGLELSFKKLLEVKHVVTFGTIATTIVLFIIGLFAAYFMGFPFMEGVYIGLILAFSSTLIVIKTLGDKNQVDTLAGRIMIGTLVLQDILVIIAVSILSVIAGAEPTGLVRWFVSLPGVNMIPWIQNLAVLVGAFLLGIIALVLNRYVARYLFRFFSHSIELLFVSSLGFFFMLSFAAIQLGFSISIGAFISGIIIANTDYYLEILNKIRTLAVFFSVLFFAALGFQVSFESFTQLLIPLAVLCGLTLFIKPIITGIIIVLFGYDKRTAILTSIHMSQLSEFSLILVASGLVLGHVTSQFVTITILSLLVTMTVSSYFMKYSAGIMNFLQRRFKSLAPDEQTIAEKIAIEHASVIVYGVEHIDEQLLLNITKTHHTLVIDPDPAEIDYLRSKNMPCMLGSLGNDEILEKLNFKQVKIVVSSVTDFEENLYVATHVRKHAPDTVLVLQAHNAKEALDLYRHGASYVMITSIVDDITVQNLLFTPDKVNLSDLKKRHTDRLVLLTSRKASAVDIDQFMAALAEQQFRPVKRAFSTTKPVFDEVDKMVKQIGNKR